MIRKSVPAVLALATIPAAIAFLMLAPSRADAQQDAPLCPATMPGGATDLACRCPETSGGASVWGTDYYTDDSALCQAAVHAGAIGSGGGVILARVVPGRDYYTGSQRNGIASSNYGSWGRTIVFDGVKAVAGGTDGVAQCPGTYEASGQGWSGTCRCPGVTDGPVWGSNPYTTDSNLCRAAMHAGVIAAAGGLVRVTSAAGRERYSGSSRNGVTTNDWGSYGGSFRVSSVN